MNERHETAGGESAGEEEDQQAPWDPHFDRLARVGGTVMDGDYRQASWLVTALQREKQFTRLFTGSVLLLRLYSATVAFLESVVHLAMGPRDTATQLLNVFLYSVPGGMILFFVRQHRYPLSTFGLTTRNSRRSAGDRLLCGVGLVPALVVFKALLVRYDPAWARRQVVEWTNWGPWQMILVHVAVAFLQEAAGRGAGGLAARGRERRPKGVGSALALY